jgi:hypothetical protein
MQVMNALALDAEGVPVGLLDQQWWLRPEEKTPWGKKDPRRPEERKSWEWVRCFDASIERLKQLAPECTPWFIMDRGSDFHGTLTRIVESDVLATVRSSYDRVILRNGKKRSLWSVLARQEVAGNVDVLIPRGHGRTQRRARLEIRYVTGEVRIRSTPRPQKWAKLSCVRVREVGYVPPGEERIEWKLLTTYSVETLEDALCVVQSYTYRWRIEDFHKAWKTGACDIESSQLRSYEALRRWATILAAVACRVERLKLLSRKQPHVDAHTEFSQAELDAAIILSHTKNFAVGGTMTLEQAVRLVASVGGYMNRKSDRPPGSITLRRGLDRITPAAEALEATRRSG